MINYNSIKFIVLVVQKCRSYCECNIRALFAFSEKFVYRREDYQVEKGREILVEEKSVVEAFYQKINEEELADRNIQVFSRFGRYAGTDGRTTFSKISGLSFFDLRAGRFDWRIQPRA